MRLTQLRSIVLLKLCALPLERMAMPHLAHSEILLWLTVMLEADVTRTPPELARMVPIPTMQFRRTEHSRAWVVSLPATNREQNHKQALTQNDSQGCTSVWTTGWRRTDEHDPALPNLCEPRVADNDLGRSVSHENPPARD